MKSEEANTSATNDSQSTTAEPGNCTGRTGEEPAPRNFFSKLDALLNILPRFISYYILCVIVTAPGCAAWFVSEEMSNMGVWADIRQALGASLLFSIFFALVLRYPHFFAGGILGSLVSRAGVEGDVVASMAKSGQNPTKDSEAATNDAGQTKESK